MLETSKQSPGDRGAEDTTDSHISKRQRTSRTFAGGLFPFTLTSENTISPYSSPESPRIPNETSTSERRETPRPNSSKTPSLTTINQRGSFTEEEIIDDSFCFGCGEVGSDNTKKKDCRSCRRTYHLHCVITPPPPKTTAAATDNNIPENWVCPTCLEMRNFVPAPVGGGETGISQVPRHPVSPPPSSVAHPRSPIPMIDQHQTRSRGPTTTTSPNNTNGNGNNNNDKKSCFPGLSTEVGQAANILLKELESLTRVKSALASSEKHVLALSKELEVERGKLILATHEIQRLGNSEAVVAEMLKMDGSVKDERLKGLVAENSRLAGENERLSTLIMRKDEEMVGWKRRLEGLVVSDHGITSSTFTSTTTAKEET